MLSILLYFSSCSNFICVTELFLFDFITCSVNSEALNFELLLGDFLKLSKGDAIFFSFPGV